MPKELNLSAWKWTEGEIVVLKEFIKKRNELDVLLFDGIITIREYIRRREKLAGEKLT